MTSKEYKLLLQMYRVQVEMPDGRKYVPISQRELSDILGLIEPFEEKKSRFSLTEKATTLLDSFEKARDTSKSDILSGMWKTVYTLF